MIVVGRPPNFLKLANAFPGALKRSTIFAYAPNIYVSNKEGLSDALKAHEQVHIERQEAYNGGPEAWWDRYLIDREFRLDEELLAHIVEYEFIMDKGSREERRKALKTVASRLSSSLYSLGLSPKQAANLIEKESCI